MQRILPMVTLVTLSLAALAQVPPPDAVATASSSVATMAAAGPADAAAPHPAMAARANATHAHAAAARIEACSRAAGALFDHLSRGDIEAAVAQFDAPAHLNVEAGELQRAWASLAQRYGTFEGRGTPQNMLYRGHTVIAIPLAFTRSDLVAQMTCDADGRLAGLQIRAVAEFESPDAVSR